MYSIIQTERADLTFLCQINCQGEKYIHYITELTEEGSKLCALNMSTMSWIQNSQAADAVWY